MAPTFVTADPPRKKAASRAKKMDHGWITWATAVKMAAKIPSGVRDLLDHARITRSETAGMATAGFMVRKR